MFKSKLIKYILLSFVVIGLFSFHSTVAQIDPSKPVIEGKCGDADGNYYAPDSDFRKPFCESGDQQGFPSFPPVDKYADWSCVGKNAGDKTVRYCQASRKPGPRPKDPPPKKKDLKWTPEIITNSKGKPVGFMLNVEGTF